MHVFHHRSSKSGFATRSSDDLNVSPNAVARFDVSLEIGADTESVHVDAAAQLLQTDRAEVRSEITTRQFENAPLPPGRNY